MTRSSIILAYALTRLMSPESQPKFLVSFRCLSPCLCVGLGVECGAHGTCAASGVSGVAGHCVCDEGYAGSGCDVLTGPCGDGSFITLGDDNSWRRMSQPGGTHCDAPNPGWGRGPYTPLQNKWYRFTGAAGNALPIEPARRGGHAACTTSAGGWLSGFPPTRTTTPVSPV